MNAILYLPIASIVAMSMCALLDKLNADGRFETKEFYREIVSIITGVLWIFLVPALLSVITLHKCAWYIAETDWKKKWQDIRGWFKRKNFKVDFKLLKK